MILADTCRYLHFILRHFLCNFLEYLHIHADTDMIPADTCRYLHFIVRHFSYLDRRLRLPGTVTVTVTASQGRAEPLRPLANGHRDWNGPTQSLHRVGALRLRLASSCANLKPLAAAAAAPESATGMLYLMNQSRPVSQ